ncbi:MAG: ATP-dependent DNA helicase [Myxococcota bacterium]|nr:ATP-dependent DNA helicase [Myxococcota bacterium]
MRSRFEHRPQQAEMAEAVLRAFETGSPALIEAGTGTGKTLAYLAPASLWSGRVVIATHTKNLQAQIARKDVPLLRRAIGESIDVVVMKGLTNYLCKRRLEAFVSSGSSPAPGASAAFGRFIEWTRRTDTGDRAEIDWMADDDPLWREVSSGPDVRIGAQCPCFKDCFVTRLRRSAADAKLIVANHHLFFADLSVSDEAGARILPRWEAAVFDEAHELEDAAASFFGVRVSTHRIELFRGDVSRRALALGPLPGAARGRLLESADEIAWLCGDLLGALADAATPAGGEEAGRRVPAGGAMLEVAAVHRECDAALRRFEETLAAAGEADVEIGLMAGRCASLRADLADLMLGDDDGHVAWVERMRSGRGDRPAARLSELTALPARPLRPPGRIAAGRTPIDVASILRDRLLGSGRPVVFTSATLAGPGGFEFVRSRLGIQGDAIELRLDSPFDFRRQALLYAPSDMPEPRDPGFLDALLARTTALLDITGGGALLLYTSFRAQRWMARALRAAGRDRLLVQGEAPRETLLERLQRERDAVLLATASFWQGIDVAGDALRLVVIDKLPFDVPSDPIVAARVERIRSRGGDPFIEYQVPVAVTTLRQGFGRLVRSTTDRGIVAILDPRIRTKRYGQAFLDALPRCSEASSLEEVAAWWKPAGEETGAGSHQH